MMAKAKTKSNVSVDLSINLTLSVEEAKALNEITGYGIEPFLKGYKEKLGSHYIDKHEKGMRSLFGTIKTSLPKEINKAEGIMDAISQVAEGQK